MKFIIKTAILTFTILFLSQNIFSQESYKLKKVVIDAGHGGKDPGAIGLISKEKDLALAVSLKLGELIKQNIPDVEVIYTRSTDVFIELHKRSQIANEKKADLFISIHINASNTKTVTGTSTFVMGLNKVQENLDVAKLENSVILIEDNYKTHYEGYNPNAPESDIIMALYQNAFLNQSINLADKVQKQFTNRAMRYDRGVRQAGLVVFWNCTMPGILVEAGFISNPEEEKFLVSEYGQNIIASAIYRAFKEYKNELEASKINNTSVNNQQLNSNNKDIQKNKSDIIFKVSIGYSKKKLETLPQNFKGLQNVQRSFDGKKYLYTVGNTTNYNEIVDLQTDIRKKFPDAFVISYKNGIFISIKDALEQLNLN
jgi:N-acetylmuramoyl-L-alanine amidase